MLLFRYPKFEYILQCDSEAVDFFREIRAKKRKRFSAPAINTDIQLTASTGRKKMDQGAREYKKQEKK